MSMFSRPYSRRLRHELLEPRRMLAGSLAGDYDADGVVDAGDYVLLRAGLSRSTVVSGQAAVGTADGTTASAYDLWRANFGDTLIPDTISVALNSTTLNVTGSNGDENILLQQSNNRITTHDVSGSFDVNKVKAIVVEVQGGSDYVSLDSLGNGGTQVINVPITVKSTAGSKSVHLANGHDVTFGGAGHTLQVAADGTATLDGAVLYWPPAGSNWFDTHIQDAALRNLGSSFYQDSRIDRSDMLALFTSAQDGGTVDATEFNDLNVIVSNTALFGTFDYVWKLSSYVVSGSTANANYQGGALGNLAAGSTDIQLGNLVNKWFLGLDRPATPYGYALASGQLFVNGPSYADIAQGGLGDCGIMSSLAEVALRNPDTITNMFIVNGDGTYTVRFYNAGVAEYVTVDSYLPGGGGVYAGIPNGELWAALAEKACAQLNELPWCQFGYYIPTANSYASIASTYIHAALGHLTGHATSAFSSMTESTFATAFNQGKSICFASDSSPPNVVGNHAYAVVGYDATTHTVTLFNPWGIGYGLTTLTWSQVQANFDYFDRTT